MMSYHESPKVTLELARPCTDIHFYTVYVVMLTFMSLNMAYLAACGCFHHTLCKLFIFFID